MKNKNEKKLTFGMIGYGRFGKLWTKYFSKHGEVFVFDKKKETIEKTLNITPSNLKQAISADIVFLTVPISELENCCEEISPLLSPKTLVVDVCSVKTWSVSVMKKHLPKNQPILATHPLFGPDSEKIRNGINGFKIVICPTKKKNELEKKLIDIFKKFELNIIISSPKEHDKQMANSQALVHLIGRGLTKMNLKPQEISTPDYDSLIRIDQMVNNDTWQLFFDMLGKNPFAEMVRQKFMGNLEDLSETIMLRNNTINDLRKSIGKVDEKIIKLLSFRFKVAKNIGILKKEHGLEIFDPAQEIKIKEIHRAYSKSNKIDEEFVNEIFNLVIKHSRSIQKKISKSNPEEIK